MRGCPPAPPCADGHRRGGCPAVTRGRILIRASFSPPSPCHPRCLPPEAGPFPKLYPSSRTLMSPGSLIFGHQISCLQVQIPIFGHRLPSPELRPYIWTLGSAPPDMPTFLDTGFRATDIPPCFGHRISSAWIGYILDIVILNYSTVKNHKFMSTIIIL